MKFVRQIGSLVFVLSAFTSIFAGIPWYVTHSTDPVLPIWMQVSIISLLGGILVVLVSLAIEQALKKPKPIALEDDTSGGEKDDIAIDAVLLSNTDSIAGREIVETLGVVQGHTVFAVWIGKDLSALVRLILGGELTEYTEMMGKARETAARRMIKEATDLNADAIVNVRYMTTSVVGSAAELLVYGTAVKLN
jgi:uncharacterized protein YbjQ (UPF0145 family)